MIQLTTRGLFEFEIFIITHTCELLQKYCCTRLIQLAKVRLRIPAGKKVISGLIRLVKARSALINEDKIDE